MTTDLRHGDSREVLKSIPDNSVDSCVTDPPYALQSIIKRYGNTNIDRSGTNETRAKARSDPMARLSGGFMGKRWDTGECAFDPEFWVDVLRVMKPGAHLFGFSSTRTYHRLAVAIEDAGFVIRDQFAWAYGSGFPKNHDISKAIDKAAGAERDRIATGKPVKRMFPGADQNKEGWIKDNGREYAPNVSEPATAAAAAAQWEGWGTAVKPAWEPIVLAQKPVEGTIAGNVLKYGTGGLNIDACRIETEEHLAEGASKLWSHYRDQKEPSAQRRYTHEGATNFAAKPGPRGGSPMGRFPANLTHDGSDEVVACFPSEAGAAAPVTKRGADKFRHTYGKFEGQQEAGATFQGDSGSAARFFYASKADAGDRWGSKHPTVKPIDLIRYYARLITPPGGLILDPFAGSGTPGVAALAEGFNSILIEREAEYVADIKERMAFYEGGERHSMSSRNCNAAPKNEGGLFGLPIPES